MFYTFRHLFFGGLYLRGKTVKTYNHLNLKTLSSKIQSNSLKKFKPYLLSGKHWRILVQNYSDFLDGKIFKWGCIYCLSL